MRRPASFAMVLLSGALFGFGLSVSTMIQPEVVLGFLDWTDFGLLGVLGAATLVTLLAYQLLPRRMRAPLLEQAFDKHPSRLDARTLVGAAIFGAGWGLCGVCPGPAIAGLGAGNWPLAVAVVAIFAGAWVQGRFFAPRPPGAERAASPAGATPQPDMK